MRLFPDTVHSTEPFEDLSCHQHHELQWPRGRQYLSGPELARPGLSCNFGIHGAASWDYYGVIVQLESKTNMSGFFWGLLVGNMQAQKKSPSLLVFLELSFGNLFAESIDCVSDCLCQSLFPHLSLRFVRALLFTTCFVRNCANHNSALLEQNMDGKICQHIMV